MTKTLPYGAWPSALSIDATLSAGGGLVNAWVASLRADGDHLYWLETRAAEGSRAVLRRWAGPGTEPEDVTAPPFDAVSRVHEYGGAAYAVDDGLIVFSHRQDGRVWQVRPGEPPRPLTPEGKYRYADFAFDRARHRVLAVREDHTAAGQPHNALVAIALADGATELLFGDSDFVAAPRLSPDGTRAAFLAWDHPNLPWDDVRLCVAALTPTGGLGPVMVEPSVGEQARLEPAWAEDGALWYASDADDWWNLYRWAPGEGAGQRVTQLQAEIGGPAWGLGSRHYVLRPDSTAWVAASQDGLWRLGRADTRSGQVTLGSERFATLDHLVWWQGALWFLAGTPAQPVGLWRAGDDGTPVRVLGPPIQALPAGYTSAPVPFAVPVGQEKAHALFFPPANPDAAGPEGTAPPAILRIHGGPTAMAPPLYAPERLFWTSRGIGVIELNYRGSTGYGRTFRQRLYGAWGQTDVEDAVATVAEAGRLGFVDPKRVAIVGGSAGGMTVLLSLALHDVFAAGISKFGVAELELLAAETHKFESRYTDKLIGPWPEAAALYRERSPATHLAGISVPLLLEQGTEDRVVPQSQSDLVHAALKAQGTPVAYLLFPGEHHGFRLKETLARCLEAELAFYGLVFGFTPADPLPPLAIENLPRGEDSLRFAPPDRSV